MKRITITVDPDDYAIVNQMAQDSDVSVSWVIRRMMRDLRERHEREGSVALQIGRTRRSLTGGT